MKKHTASQIDHMRKMLMLSNESIIREWLVTQRIQAHPDTMFTEISKADPFGNTLFDLNELTQRIEAEKVFWHKAISVYESTIANTVICTMQLKNIQAVVKLTPAELVLEWVNLGHVVRVECDAYTLSAATDSCRRITYSLSNLIDFAVKDLADYNETLQAATIQQIVNTTAEQLQVNLSCVAINLGLRADSDIDSILEATHLAVTKAEHIDDIISGAAFSEYYPIIYGSGEYLTEFLTPELINDGEACDKFILSHACQHVENWTADQIYDAIEDAGTNHMIAVQAIAERYKVI